MLDYQTHDLLELPGIKHGFFSRKGGVSLGHHWGLNVGEGSDDDPEKVLENRRRVASEFGIEVHKLISLHQIHSKDTVYINAPPQTKPKADGAITRERSIALSALGADCAPVLFADPKTMTIAACHAGWRGALSGITDTVIADMQRCGASPNNIRAVIGPCISQASYEVGSDFKQQFINNDPNFARFFKNLHSAHNDRIAPHFDIKRFLLWKLREAGLNYISAVKDCTYANPDTYFSYRYNTHNNILDYGRNVSVIMLT